MESLPYSHFPLHSPRVTWDSPLEVITSPLKWQEYLYDVAVSRYSPICHHLVVWFRLFPTHILCDIILASLSGSILNPLSFLTKLVQATIPNPLPLDFMETPFDGHSPPPLMRSPWSSYGDSTFQEPTFSWLPLSILWWALISSRNSIEFFYHSDGKMSMWRFHVAYKGLDVQSIYWYPKKCMIKKLIHVPKFDGDSSSIVAHVTKFIESMIHSSIEQEDMIVRLFLLSIEERKRDWIKHSCSPKSISSSIILIWDFLKHWSSRNQKLKDTIQDLEGVLQGCSFL